MRQQEEQKTYECPSCGEMVEVGDVICKNCGTNLKSGETFETRVKRQGSKARHPEQFADTVLVGGVVVFLLIVLTSFMIQKRAVGIIREDPPGMRPAIIGVELVGQLVDIATDPDLSAEEKSDLGYELVQQTRYDVYAPLYNARIAPSQDAKMDDLGTGENPGEYAQQLANKIIRGIEFRQGELSEMQEGTTQMAVRRRKSTYGEDFNLGAYKRFLEGLKSQLEAHLNTLRNASES